MSKKFTTYGAKWWFLDRLPLAEIEESAYIERVKIEGIEREIFFFVSKK